MIKKPFSNLDKTYCQKGLSLKVPYFVTEVILTFINCLMKKKKYYSKYSITN